VIDKWIWGIGRIIIIITLHQLGLGESMLNNSWPCKGDSFWECVSAYEGIVIYYTTDVVSLLRVSVTYYNHVHNSEAGRHKNTTLQEWWYNIHRIWTPLNQVISTNNFVNILYFNVYYNPYIYNNILYLEIGFDVLCNVYFEKTSPWRRQQ
jgi:hypothetical protein